MTIILPEIDYTIIEDLDFEPACESALHESYGSGDAVAVVKLKHPCCGGQAEGLFCQGCLDFVTTSEKVCRCIPAIGGCGGSFQPYKDVVQNYTYI